MIATPFDGLDVLCHRAKFGEDRQRALVVGAKICLCVLPVFKLLRGRTSAFSPNRGNSLRPFTRVNLDVQNFTTIGAELWECGPKISQIPLFHKQSPTNVTGEHLGRFLKVKWAFIRPSVLHYLPFYFEVIRFISYRLLTRGQY